MLERMIWPVESVSIIVIHPTEASMQKLTSKLPFIKGTSTNFLVKVLSNQP